jgi:hypothetical protein
MLMMHTQQLAPPMQMQVQLQYHDLTMRLNHLQMSAMMASGNGMLDQNNGMMGMNGNMQSSDGASGYTPFNNTGPPNGT